MISLLHTRSVFVSLLCISTYLLRCFLSEDSPRNQSPQWPVLGRTLINILEKKDGNPSMQCSFEEDQLWRNLKPIIIQGLLELHNAQTPFIWLTLIEHQQCSRFCLGTCVLYANDTHVKVVSLVSWYRWNWVYGRHREVSDLAFPSRSFSEVENTTFRDMKHLLNKHTI